MTKKDFLLALGDRSVNPGDTDELLRSKVSERRRKEIERQEELDSASHEAKMADLRKKTKSADSAMEKGEGKKEEGPMKFEVKGGVNLGTIDLQQEREEARKELAIMKKEADDSARATGQENQQLRERIHEQEIKTLEITFKAQMEAVTKAIEANASKGNFTEQLAAARAIAEEIGYQKGAAGGGSEMIQIELKKLDFEHARAMRQMAKDDKAEDRRWQMELRRLDDERDARRAELARETKKDEMFAKAPEVIGRAIGRAIVEGGGEVETEAPVSSRARMPGIEAGLGESGEAECINCHEPVAIGPTARSAVCAGCGAKYPIKRVAAEAQSHGPIKGQESQTSQEESEE